MGRKHRLIGCYAREEAGDTRMPLVDQAPSFTLDEAAAVIQQLYGLWGELRELPGERDQNFMLHAVDENQYVFKISNAAEDPQRIDFQHKAMLRLETQIEDYVFPHACATKENTTLTQVEGPDGAKHWVSLLTYVPGVCLAEVNPHTSELLEEVGRMVGTIDRAFAGWSHPAMHRLIHWDIRYAEKLRPQLADIAQPERRALVERVLDRFDTHVAPRFEQLRSSVIYNDANDYNVLVSEPGTERHIVGTIDFGDMVHGAVVCDVAVAATYAMFGKSDPLTAAADVVRAYHAVFPLEEHEVALVYDLVCTRLALSVCHAATQQHEVPDNAYLGISEAPAWALLEQLSVINLCWAHYVLRHACGWEPCPQSAAVVRWLREHPEAVAPVIAADLRAEPLVVFDLSVGSTNPALDHVREPERFSRALFDQMRDQGVRLGIGRYDEARLVYSADQFASETAERRTVHLGTDIFVEPGEPVYAALDGVVHSFRDNALPLDYGPTIILQHEADGLPFWTLYGHLDRASLEQMSVGKPIKRGEQIARIGTLGVNGGWPPHLHIQLISTLR